MSKEAISTERALKLALEALKQIDEAMPFPVAKLAQAALRKALANEALDKMAENARELGLDYEPSSVSKLAREAGIRDCTCNGALGCLERFASLVRADERARMAEQPAQQEPVAWARNLTDPQPHCVTALKYMSVADTDAGVQYTPLYISPQAQRTWVGLTDVEWMNIVNKDQAWFGQRPDEVAHEVAKLVEAKLKEKNNG